MHNVRQVVSMQMLCKSSIDNETTLFCRCVNANLFMLLICSFVHNKYSYNIFVCYFPCLAVFDIVGGGGGGGALINVVRTCSPTPLFIKAIKYV